MKTVLKILSLHRRRRDGKTINNKQCRLSIIIPNGNHSSIESIKKKIKKNIIKVVVWNVDNRNYNFQLYYYAYSVIVLNTRRIFTCGMYTEVI